MGFTRNDIIKAVGACAVSALTVVCFAGINSATAGSKYAAGTYTATATGIGEVTMTATFSGTSITDIQLDVSNETPEIGGVAAETLTEQLMTAQSSEIDGVAGATLTTSAAQACLDDCISQATIQ